MSYTFNTGNPVGPNGSADARDLVDNAQVADRLITSTEMTAPDRLGVQRRTWAGINQSIAGYTNRGEWTTVTAYNVNDIWRDGPTGAFYLVLADYTSGASAAADIAGGNVVVHQPKDWVVSVTTIADLRALEPAFDRQEVSLGEHTAGTGLGGGMFYADFSSTSADDNGVTVVTSGGKRWVRKLDGFVTPVMFGAVGDGVADETSLVVAFFARVKAEKLFWVVPAGDYSINPDAPIDIISSGICQGRFLVPNSNQTFRFQIVRDEPGQVISTSGWGAITRGKSDVQAANAAGKNLYLSSTEIQIERIGSGGAPYLKQEFIRCMPSGNFSTAAVNTYNSFANLTVTAYEPSRPVRVDGLTVQLSGPTGGTEAARGFIVVNRDSVTLNSPSVVNTNTAQPRPVAIENGYCADTVINSPRVRGFDFNGLGYGIINASSIGLTVNQADLQDCRHGYTGVFTVDVTLNGGNYGRTIDDHWTDRFVANNPKVYAIPGSSAFMFAGNDVTLNDPAVSGGRSLFTIRNDTPNLGGRVIIRNPTISTRGETGPYYYLFGFDSPNGQPDPGFTFTNRPRLPDLVEISNPSIDSDTADVYGAFLGMLYFPHTAWGTIRLDGSWETTGSILNGVLAYKDATHQQDRVPLIDISGVDCGTGNLLYITALDAVSTRAFNVRLGQGAAGNMRYSGASVNVLDAMGARIGSITDDNPAVAPAGFYRFVGCTFSGGAVSATLRNHLISSSVFSGSYSQFPLIADISMDGNVRTGSGITGLPADIRNNIVAPFNP